MLNNREYEEKYSNLNYICGVDEVGRGPLVGPVVASAVILPKNYFLEGLTDSKKLSKKKREYFYEIIKKDALSIGMGIVDNKKIDEINILEASRLAMKKAINNLSIKPDVILTDAMKLNMGILEEDIIKGDLKSITISAASIIAKVMRDQMMEELHDKYPMYNFIKNNGYPTKEHIEAIYKYGIIEEHRKTFRPIKDIINN
jgi:ribonuclease HII